MSEPRLRMFLNALDDMVFELDGAGRLLSVWARDDRRLPLPRAEMEGHLAVDAFGGDAGGQLQHAAQRVLTSRKSIQVEYSLSLPRGRRLHSARLSPLCQADGVPRSVCCLVRDITERRRVEKALQTRNGELEQNARASTAQLRAVNQELFDEILERRRTEDALKKSEALFHSVWDRSVDGMRLTDGSGVIHQVNQAFCRITGMAKEQLVGQPFTVVYSAEYQEHALAKYQRRFAAREIQPHLARELRLWNGQRVWVELSNSFLDMPGEAPLLLSVMRDITESRRLEEQYRQAQKLEAVGRLAGGVAHDFNNLLTAILGTGDVIARKLSPDDALRGHVEVIQKAGERAAALTRQLLAFSRKQVIAPVVLELNRVIADMEKILRPMLGQSIDLRIDLESTLHAVKADAGQIEQVLMNLVVNARDAMPQGGRLTVRTHNAELSAASHPEARPGAYAVLSVADTGCGMDEHTQSRIFEPFFTTKEPGKGTGLGLATVYGIVQQSGGFVEVHSEPRRGTTFCVYLPLAVPAPGPRVATAAVDGASKGSETVLLVEDEEDVLALARLALRTKGYPVLEARTGPEALRLCAEHSEPIHLLLTDIMLPGMDGRQLADRLADRTPRPKVLFMSGCPTDVLLPHGIFDAHGAFLPKPFTPDGLARKVREVLDAPAGVLAP